MSQEIIIEPHFSYSDQDLIYILSVWGAHYIDQLTSGFIATEIDEHYLYCLEKIAFIHSAHKRRGISYYPEYKNFKNNL